MTLAVLACATAAGVAVQRISGMGLSLVAVPLLAIAVGPLDAIRIALLLGLPVYLSTALTARGSVRWGDVLRLGVPALALTPLLAVVVRDVPQRPMVIVAAVTCLAAVAVLATGVTARALAGAPGAIGAGVLSAAMNVTAGIAGPPAAMYGVNAGWGAEEARGTLSAYFFLLSLVAVPSLGLPSTPAGAGVVVLAAALGGHLLGRLLARRVTDRRARAVVLVLSAAGGTTTLLHTLL